VSLDDVHIRMNDTGEYTLILKSDKCDPQTGKRLTVELGGFSTKDLLMLRNAISNDLMAWDDDGVIPQPDGMSFKQLLSFVWAIEESSEIIQAICKLLRFGALNSPPGNEWTNHDLLAKEIGNFQAAVNRLLREGRLSTEGMRFGMVEKETQPIPGLDFPVPIKEE